MATINWKKIKGGNCLFGDTKVDRDVSTLAWSSTPISYGNLGVFAKENYPITNVNQNDAKKIAISLGGRLPTSTEWEWMAAGPERREFPWGNDPWDNNRANLAPLELTTTTPVENYFLGITPQGLYDVAGNVWEWTSSTTPNNGAYIRGGSYASKIIYAKATFRNVAPIELKSNGIGFRIVKEL